MVHNLKRVMDTYAKHGQIKVTHEHNYAPTDYPNSGLDEVTINDADGNDKTVKIHQGVCRDPSNKKLLWCYTTSAKVWDYCDVQLAANIEVTIKLKDRNEAPFVKSTRSGIDH